MEVQAQETVTQEVQQQPSPEERFARFMTSGDRSMRMKREQQPEQKSEAEQQAPEQAQPEQQPEQKEERQAEQESEDSIQIDFEAPLFETEFYEGDQKVKRKLSIKEMQAALMMQKDYQRKTAQLAREREEMERKVQEQITPRLQEYAQGLETYKQALLRMVAPEFQNVDLQKLAQDDPITAQQLFFKQLQLNQTLNAITEAQKRAQEQLQAQQRQHWTRFAAEAWSTLERDVPGWNDDAYKGYMAFGKEYGYSDQEVASWLDPRIFKLLADAKKYRDIQKAKPEVEKKIVGVPKVIKPGTPQGKSDKNSATQELRKKLRETGRDEYAAALIAQRL